MQPLGVIYNKNGKISWKRKALRPSGSILPSFFHQAIKLSNIQLEYLPVPVFATLKTLQLLRFVLGGLF